MTMKTSLSQDSLIIQVEPYVEDSKHEDFCNSITRVCYFICNLIFIVYISWGFYLLTITVWKQISGKTVGSTDFAIEKVLLGFLALCVISLTIVVIIECTIKIYKKVTSNHKSEELQ